MDGWAKELTEIFCEAVEDAIAELRAKGLEPVFSKIKEVEK